MRGSIWGHAKPEAWLLPAADHITVMPCATGPKLLGCCFSATAFSAEGLKGVERSIELVLPGIAALNAD
jgi:hypothetical protein